MPTTIENDPDVRENCQHHDHNPPSMIVVPHGKILRHVCPECGKETVIRPPCISL